MATVCQHCNALRWPANKEKASICCYNGALAHLQLPPPPPPLLRDLWLGNDQRSQLFRKYARMLNNCTALSSLRVREPDQTPGRHPPNIILQGKLYHMFGPLHAPNNRQPSFAQMYVQDPAYISDDGTRLGNIAFPDGLNYQSKYILADLLRDLRACLSEANPFVRDFIQASAVNPTEVANAIFVINPDARPVDQPEGRYNLNFSEIAVLIDQNAGARDVVVRPRGGGLQTIDETHRAYDSLHFMLLFPFGTEGWHIGLRRRDNAQPVTARQFYAYHLMKRADIHNFLLYAQRLLQEFICTGFAKVENLRLRWISRNQQNLRTDTYINIVEAVAQHQENNNNNQRPVVGRRVILPASFIGSPRDMLNQFLDGIAISTSRGPPSFFVTFTCNPSWREITENLEPNQVGNDRPDLIARVFRMKLNQLKNDISQHQIFGRQIGVLVSIEFQKRGLPHAHILIILHPDDKPRTGEDIDNVISAEIPPNPDNFPEGSPEREQAERLESIVLRHMLHGPCGVANPNCPCMKNGKCSKYFPKPFVQHTHWGLDDIGPKYRRRNATDGGRVVYHNGRLADNTCVVPYNPFLSLKYESHINVEASTSVRAIKYLFKYVLKGPDRSIVAITVDAPVARDEVVQWQDMRSLGAAEASYRIFDFEVHSKSPAVVRLPIHLENEQLEFFNDDDAVDVANRNPRSTPLTGFFDYNAANPDNAVRYCDMPTQHVYRNNRWRPRLVRDVIGRVHNVHLLSGELLYLRLLLHHLHSCGKTSFADLRTVNGIVFPTFKDACEELGILMNDGEWSHALRLASNTHNSPQCRYLFVILLIFCNPTNAQNLFDTYWNFWYDDYQRQWPQINDDNLLRTMVLAEIEKKLVAAGKSLLTYGLTALHAQDYAWIRENTGGQDNPVRRSPIVEEELSYPYEDMQNIVNERLLGPNSLLPEQQIIFDTAMASVHQQTPHLIFVDAPAGTGKTYLLNTLLAAVRTINNDPVRPEIAIAVAFTAKSAHLLIGGTTLHSRFLIPIKLSETMNSMITQQSGFAELLRLARIIVFDEAPSAHKYLLECIDRLLRDICGNQTPFGGKILVLAGDFRQCLPVMPRSGRAEIVGSIIKNSFLWPHFQIFQLQTNMRIFGEEHDPATLARLRQFSNFLLSIGNGTFTHGFSDDILLTEAHCHLIAIDNSTPQALRQSRNALIDWTFPDFQQNCNNINWLKDRYIMATTNFEIDEFNYLISERMPGASWICSSADVHITDGNALPIPVEHLNSLSPSGMPPHNLHLRPGMPLMVLRNLRQPRGLCNGTKVVLIAVHEMRLLEAVILEGEFEGTTVFIPRIICQPKEGQFPFSWQRLQFPIRPSFACTNNKSQGDTAERIGVWLENSVFAHGQLYVAASRVKSPDNLCFAIVPREGRFVTRNVVYREVFV